MTVVNSAGIRSSVERRDLLRAKHEQRAPWPYADLDVAKRRAAGWRPTPVGDLVLKIHQRCNLACDYCYVYEQVDQSWRDRPAVMSKEICHAALNNLARHVATHSLRKVRVILHGGEPLLYGAPRLAALANDIRERVPCAEIGIQTNGVLLTEPMMNMLRAHRIMVGISLDGVEEDHDKHRRTRNGRGSFAKVRRAIDILRRPENRASYAGLLCTVSPETDPIATMDQLLAFEPPSIDLLLPHANWVNQPCEAGYGQWLKAAFDRWQEAGTATSVKLFEDIMCLLLGGQSTSEQVGLSPAAVIVIESDGAIEQVDALKSAYPGACAMGLDVRRDELDAALWDPGVVSRQIGIEALPPACNDCEIRRVCGGGHYAHRYSPAGFRNRTVYCADMKDLIEHVGARVQRRIRPILERDRYDNHVSDN